MAATHSESACYQSTNANHLQNEVDSIQNKVPYFLN